MLYLKDWDEPNKFAHLPSLLVVSGYDDGGAGAAHPGSDHAESVQLKTISDVVFGIYTFTNVVFGIRVRLV